jgi:putative ATPase
MDLFKQQEDQRIAQNAPLAVRMRPRNLNEFVGQSAFMAEGKLLWRMLKADRLSSLIFYGPPGTGKTTLASIVSGETESEFIAANATTIGVKQVREVLTQARVTLATRHKRTVLFLDEIHRFNKAQQDVLLEDVENGVVILIGATTENPYFSVNAALVSRSTIFEFTSISDEDIVSLLHRALADKERGLGHLNVVLRDDAANYIAIMSNGDCRRALGALEVGVLSCEIEGDTPLIFDEALAAASIQKKAIVSDAAGDNHYDLASALQKSMRGSDPDATVYWLARLIVGGEDPRFIARRIAVCAAEDVGNCDPMATILAAAAVQISEFVGLPEAQLVLAQAAIYIACAPKSNRITVAISGAINDVTHGKTAQVPDHLKDGHYSGAKKMGKSVGYKYPHDYSGGFVAQSYMPQSLKKAYYQPSDRGREAHLGEYLAQLQVQIDQMQGS